MIELTTDEKRVLEIALAHYVQWVEDLESQGCDHDSCRESLLSVEGIAVKAGLQVKEILPMDKDILKKLKIPDFSVPTEDCFLSVDKNGDKLEVGDLLTSNLYPLRGHEKEIKFYNPVEEREGKLIIPHYGSYLLNYFVKAYCEIANRTVKPEHSASSEPGL